MVPGQDLYHASSKLELASSWAAALAASAAASLQPPQQSHTQCQRAPSQELDPAGGHPVLQRKRLFSPLLAF